MNDHFGVDRSVIVEMLAPRQRPRTLDDVARLAAWQRDLLFDIVNGANRGRLKLHYENDNARTAYAPLGEISLGQAKRIPVALVVRGQGGLGVEMALAVSGVAKEWPLRIETEDRTKIAEIKGLANAVLALAELQMEDHQQQMK